MLITQTPAHARCLSFPDLHDDVSAGMVLNASRAASSYDTPLCDQQSFDVDGLLGVWALTEPKLALDYREVLREAALIGDFREYDPSNPNSEAALKLVCWINEVEKSHFYRPFGSTHEMLDCVEKYEFFLPRLSEILAGLDKYVEIWGPEYERVKADWALRSHPT